MSSISVAGDSSGSITIAAPAVAGSGTLTLPVATDTLAGIAATQTLTNKTLGTGTVFPAGAVLQVVSATYATLVSNGTASYIDSGLTASITPKFSTSKILVLVSQNGVSGASSVTGVNLQLLRGASSISIFGVASAYGATSSNITVSCNYLDSPATTSATTYKTQFVRYAGANAYTQSNGDMSTITLMEIAG